VVSNSNTVVYPRTVVIKSVYASLTHSAVAGPRSTNHLAVRAKLSKVLINFDQSSELDLWPEVTRVSQKCQYVK
jgi:hypothetical protein